MEFETTADYADFTDQILKAREDQKPPIPIADNPNVSNKLLVCFRRLGCSGSRSMCYLQENPWKSRNPRFVSEN